MINAYESKLLDEHAVYNFMAPKFGYSSFNTVEDYANNISSIPKLLRPKLSEGVYIIEDQKIISVIYTVVCYKYCVRVVNGDINTYFVRNTIGKDGFRVLDIQTQDVIEHYEYENDLEKKFCSKTNTLLQTNYLTNFNNLPPNIKINVENFFYKNNIFAYGIKPYGTAIYFLF
jgi:hypothetical protein